MHFLFDVLKTLEVTIFNCWIVKFQTQLDSSNLSVRLKLKYVTLNLTI